jgi:hypothetical protein
LYVLVAQPCDLMVRQDGKRHHTVENGLLLEATPIDDAPREGDNDHDHESDFYFRLDFLEPERDWQINLRRIHYVSLEVLDLCVFQQDGSCSLVKGQEVPSLMSEAWRARFPRVVARMDKVRNRYAELMKMKGMKAADASRIVISAAMDNLLQCQIIPKTGSITFDISRIGRIKQPRSGALLARYANAFARDAFEHDLTRRPKKVSLAPLNYTSRREMASVSGAAMPTVLDPPMEQAERPATPYVADTEVPEPRPTDDR